MAFRLPCFGRVRVMPLLVMSLLVSACGDASSDSATSGSETRPTIGSFALSEPYGDEPHPGMGEAVATARPSIGDGDGDDDAAIEPGGTKGLDGGNPGEAAPEVLAYAPGPGGAPVMVVTSIGSGTATYTQPSEGAESQWFQSPTQFGGPRVFLVLGGNDDYYEVSLPIRPNGSTGWIKRDEVTVTTVTHRARVDLSDNTLTVWNGDEVILNTAAATGKRSTPTPIGEFYVRDIIPKRSGGAYGPYILALSGFSEVLDTFAGGLPAIAIHGTNRPDLVGTEASSGCIRIPNDLIEMLAATVPLGTPVSVVA